MHTGGRYFETLSTEVHLVTRIVTTTHVAGGHYIFLIETNWQRRVILRPRRILAVVEGLCFVAILCLHDFVNLPLACVRGCQIIDSPHFYSDPRHVREIPCFNARPTPIRYDAQDVQYSIFDIFFVNVHVLCDHAMTSSYFLPPNVPADCLVDQTASKH